MKDITIKDIALSAGVSVATVSRVINGVKNVKPATVDKVLATIAATGYVPNATAQQLKSDSTKVIGLLVSNISNSHFTTMAKTIDHVLHKSGYNIIVCNTNDDQSLEREYLHRLLSLRVDGIIINTTGQNDEYISNLSSMIPMVLVDRNITYNGFIGDFVGSNGYGGVLTLTNHLIELGHRNIAIITSNLKTSTGRERLAGFKAAMQKIGVIVDNKYPYRYDSDFFNIEGGIAGCKALMSLKKPPTAIVIANNAMAIGAYKYLHSCGISVPDQISIVSYGTIENSDLFKVEPTYTTLNPAFIGEKAASLLLSRIQDNTKGNREVIFEPVLVTSGTSRFL